MKNKIAKLPITIVILLSVTLSSCFGPLSREYYQPVPPGYKLWSKLGASELEVKKSMLECGAKNPSGGARISTRNEVISRKFCLESLGYKASYGKMKQLCQLSHNKNYPACQPNAIIPKPSIEVRLNSEYCQNKRRAISNNIKSNNANYEKCVKKINNPNVYVSESKATFCDYYKILTPECKP